MSYRPACPVWNSFTLDPAASASRPMQIVAFLRDAILDGQACPGLRLPSNRVLAADPGILVPGFAAISPDRMADATRLLRRSVLP